MAATTDGVALERSVSAGSARERPFLPARFLGNPHLQTIVGGFLRVRRGPRVTRERLELPDGDFLDIDCALPERPLPGKPWALVLHGLEGSSRAPYVRGVARQLLGRGIEACLLNYRGCSGEPNRLPRSYHSGESHDVRSAIDFLARSREGRPFGIVGFSIGANILMKLLGEYGQGAPETLRAAVVVAPPYDLTNCAAHLDSPSLFFYREWLLRTLRAKALAKIAAFPGVADAGAIRSARTFFAFDEAYTAPIHGFKNARDYWERCSGIVHAPAITRETVIISSLDDPFFPRGHVPEAELKKNPRIELVLTPGGGHVGFVSGSPLAPLYWAEELAAEVLARRLS